MPRYFFDIVINHGAVSPDEDGTVLPDIEAAREEAFETLLEMAKERRPRRGDTSTLGMVVRDEGGRSLLTMAVGYSEEQNDLSN